MGTIIFGKHYGLFLRYTSWWKLLWLLLLFGWMISSYLLRIRCNSFSCQVLRAMRSDGLLQPFSNVKFLSLNYDTCIHESLLRLLEFFLNLKTLVIKDYGGYCDSEVKFKPNPSNPFLAELKTVEVTWLSRGRSFIFPFIKILLKHASKLEKLVFRVARTAASDVLLLASKELLGMRRSSPRAKMVFHEYWSYPTISPTW